MMARTLWCEAYRQRVCIRDSLDDDEPRTEDRRICNEYEKCDWRKKIALFCTLRPPLP
jgi:hypothetical protein